MKYKRYRIVTYETDTEELMEDELSKSIHPDKPAHFKPGLTISVKDIDPTVKVSVKGMKDNSVTVYHEKLYEENRKLIKIIKSKLSFDGYQPNGEGLSVVWRMCIHARALYHESTRKLDLLTRLSTAIAKVGMRLYMTIWASKIENTPDLVSLGEEWQELVDAEGNIRGME
jgi:hypothetical protein